MSTGSAQWVGADPGGKGRFGVAVMTGDEVVRSGCVDCADEAVAFVREHLKGVPAGVAVDAPLWWSSGPSGDRHADQWLREHYGLSGGEVQAGNSLRGAALIQGAMFVRRLREVWSGVRVAECHPKALLKAVTGNRWTKFCSRFRVSPGPVNEHERDAIIAAVAAREAFEGRWSHDLGASADLLPVEQDQKERWLAPISYYWPEK